MAPFFLFSFPVAAPTSVSIASDPANPVRPIGSNVNLTCIVELSPVENISVTFVNTVWTGPAGFMTAHTALPVMGNTTTYTSTTTVNSFGRDQSGVYNCTAAVSTIPTNSFPSGSVMSGVKRVTVGT